MAGNDLYGRKHGGAVGLLGPLSTAVLGLAFAAIYAAREMWVGAVVLVVLAIGVAAAERWADRHYPESPAWTGLHWIYVGVVLVVTVVYVAATGGEFYRVTLPALAFIPAMSSIGRGLRAWRANES